MLQCCNKQEENVYIYIYIYIYIYYRNHMNIFFIYTYTARKVSEVILVRIFPHLNRMWRDTPYLSVFSPNAGKSDQNNPKHGHFLCSDTFIYNYLCMYMYISTYISTYIIWTYILYIHTLRKKFPYSGLFWSAFSRI